MKPHQIETWVLEIISRVEARQPIEDSQVELKATWPKPEKAARQIAAHANAAQGSRILWLIGIDEKRGVTGAPYAELAEWYPQIKAQFESLAPLLTHFNIPVQGKTVAALLFDTDRAPYLIRNPLYGKHNGGPVAFEVPWRENNSTRTATRADLLRMLTPLVSMPKFEVLQGSLSASRVEKAQEKGLFWSLKLEIYVETSTEEVVVIPFHRCKVCFEIPGKVPASRLEEFSLTPPQLSGMWGAKERHLSLTINSTPDEIIIKGPGKIFLNASLSGPDPLDEGKWGAEQAALAPDWHTSNGSFLEKIAGENVEVRTSIFPVNARSPIGIDLILTPKPGGETKQLSWQFVSSTMY